MDMGDASPATSSPSASTSFDWSTTLPSLPFVPLNPYNGTVATGGDSKTDDLNTFYDAGDLAWVLASTALVLLQTPGVGLFYSGLARRKSALSLVWISLMAAATTSFQWFFWGYSLTFSHKAGSFLGKLDNFGFMNVLGQPSVMSTKVPDLLVAVYQGMFACLTNAILIGAVAERGRMLPAIVFMFIWSTLVYNVIAEWTWNPMGWSYKMGTYDFAGGTPVHISSGTGALAYSLWVGKRRGYGGTALNFRPHNVVYIALGTVFLWVGWFGFNAGSAMTASLRAAMAAMVTNLAASVGGITWCLMDYRLNQKFSLVGFCSGVVAGLVCITPGSGFVPAWAAVIYGLVSGIACNLGTRLKFIFGVDDALDIFAVHAIGGFSGNILTAFFAADYIAALDGYTQIPGGWINHHWVQLRYHLAASVAGMSWSFVVTSAILVAMNWIPGLKLRTTEDDEIGGMDEAEIGEFAYDYVEVTRDVDPSTAATIEKVDLKRSNSRKRMSLRWGQDGLHRNPTHANKNAIGTAV